MLSVNLLCHALVRRRQHMRVLRPLNGFKYLILCLGLLTRLFITGFNSANKSTICKKFPSLQFSNEPIFPLCFLVVNDHMILIKRS